MMKKALTESTKTTIKAKFLDIYRRTGIVGPAARAAGVASPAISSWRKADRSFDRSCEDAEREAVLGTDEPVVFQGQLQIGPAIDINGNVLVDPVTGKAQMRALTVKKYSDFLMKLLVERLKVGRSGSLRVLDERNIPRRWHW